MKIYILNVPKKLQPVFQPIRYPRHNENYGVEQDFFTYINNNNSILTKNPDEANWHYLPVFWTKWHLNHNYGKQGVTELQEEVNKILVNTFKNL